MRCGKRGVLGALTMLILPLAAPAAQTGAAVVADAPAQEAAAEPRQVVGFSTSSRSGTLTLHLADGTSVRVAARRGTISVDGREVATYDRAGPVDDAWQALLGRAGALSTDQLVMALRGWSMDGLPAGDAAALEALRGAIQPFEPFDATVEVPAAPAVPRVPPLSEMARAEMEAARAIQDEMADARAAMRDEVRTTIRDGIRVQLRDEGGASMPLFGPVESIPQGLLGLFGTFLALAGIAFGASFFAERQLDIVADTASASLARSFFVGLFAQPLVLPAFGMLIVGLVLTVVGVVVVPFAAAAFVAALVAALVGGYLAMARAAGEAFARRRGTALEAGPFSTLRKTAWGLMILLAIWLPAILLGWARVAGPVVTWTAVLVTWAILTTGFGAFILTRGGLRGTFGRKFRHLATTALPRPGDGTSVFDTNEWLASEPTETR